MAASRNRAVGRSARPRRAFAALVALACAAPLAAQEDTGMMAHDSAMTDHGGAMHDGKAMDDKMMADDKTMQDGGAAKRKLKLTSDFAVPAALDLYLVLATGDEPGDGALYLGKLSQPAAGEQTFELPKGKDLGGYTRLLVWSKKEKRAVASAPWHPEDGHAMDEM